MNIQGTIKNEAGTPVAGAKVDIFVGGTAIAGVNSGSSGGFEFSNETPCAGQELKFVVTKQGYEPLIEVTHPGQEEVTVDLKLKEPRHPTRVAGKVIDQNGRPVVGAKVEFLDGETAIAEVNSSASGGFEFSTETDYAGQLLKVVVTKHGFETLKQDIRGEAQTDLRLNLKEGQRIVATPLEPAVVRKGPTPLPVVRWIVIVGVLVVGGMIAFLLMSRKKPTPRPPVTKPTVALTLDRTKISEGEKAILTWSSTDAQFVDLTDLGRSAPNGSRPLSPPKGTHRYKAVAYDSRGESAQSPEVILTVIPSRPRGHALFGITTMKVTPDSTRRGRNIISVQVTVKNSGDGASGRCGVDVDALLQTPGAAMSLPLGEQWWSVDASGERVFKFASRSAENASWPPGRYEIRARLKAENSADGVTSSEKTATLVLQR